MSGLSFRVPNLQSSFTGNEAIEMVGDKIPEMNGLQGTEPSAPLELLGDSVGQIADIFSPQEDVNTKFQERNKNIIRGMRNVDKLSDTLSGAAIKTGNPFAIAAGAAMKVGSAIGKSAEDEFGVVKDKGKAIIGGILNPIRGISTAFGQNERKDARTKFSNTELASKAAESQVAGNKITNSIPRYNPPGYGRFGRKI